MDRGRRESLRAFFREEAADASVLGLRPDEEEIGDRRVADPGLGAREAVAARDFLRARLHARRIGAVVGLGQAEAADQLSFRELRQVLLLLSLGAELVDRRHDERALHAHRRAVAGIHALELARDQPVAHVVDAGAAVFGRKRGPQEPERAHLAQDRGIRLLVAESLQDARLQFLLREGARRIAHHALGLGELRLEQQRILPGEFGLLGFGFERRVHGNSPFGPLGFGREQ